MSDKKDNSGVLFRNERQRAGKRDPDYQGKCLVGGVELEMSAWVNTSKTTNKKYLSIMFRVPKDRDERREEKPQDDSQENMPF